MFLFQATVVTLFCVIGLGLHTLASFTTRYSTLYKWVNFTQVSILDLEPVGGEIWDEPKVNLTTYLARSVYHDSFGRGKSFQTGIIPGKYFVDGKEPRGYMYYSVNGTEHVSTDFEVLTYPRGSMSWISDEKISSIDEKVVGGIDPFTSESIYLCRLAHKLNETFARLTPGKLSPSGECVVPYLGELISNANYEVLVVNAYGKYLYA